MFNYASLFAFIGPFIGILSFSLVNLFSTAHFQSGIESAFQFIFFCLIMSFWGYPVALLIGAIPSFVGSLIYCLYLKRNTTKNPNIVKRMSIGGLCGMSSASCCALILYILAPSINDSLMGYLRFYTIPGLISGSICAAFSTQKIYEFTFNES